MSTIFSPFYKQENQDTKKVLTKLIKENKTFLKSNVGNKIEDTI